MRQRWVLPAVVVALLLLAWATRWNTEAQKTYTSGDYAVVKWERDRWTGRLWIYGYGKNAMERIASNGYDFWVSYSAPARNANANKEGATGAFYAKEEKDALTKWWSAATALTALWLLWSLRKPRQAKALTDSRVEVKAAEG